MNRPCQVQLTDGSGHQLRNSYFAYNSKGDLTSSATLVGSNYLSTTNTYNSNGTLATTTDPNQNQTSTTYGACNSGLLTKVTLPNGLYSQTGWDSGCWGVPISTTDLAGNTSTAAYSDPFYRITQSTDPLSNSTTITYGHNPPTSESVMDWGTSTQDIYNQSNPTLLNAYHQVYDPVNSGWESVITASSYNSTGAETTTTTPCFASAKGSPCSGAATTVTHDALGRALVTTDGGGGTITNTYSASTSCTSGLSACLIKLTVLGPTPAGELLKQVAQETNGLGQLVASCTISSGPGSGACGFGGYSGYLTSTVYNADGTVASVTRGSQTHSFTYDSTGRVISKTTPESGTKQFFYDSAPSTPGVACSTLSLPTNSSPLGNLLKTYDANGTTTCYSYDKIGRVVAIAYAGTNFDGANKYFIYDSSTVNGVAVGANGHVAEAYTAATISGTKITDEGFLYTARGELSDVYQWSTHSGGWYHTGATYVANGAPATLTGVPGGTWTFGVDGKGRLNTASQGSSSMVSSVTYNAFDEPLVTTLGLGDTDTYTYDATTGRMKGYVFSIGASPTTLSGTLNWNPNGTLRGLAIVDGINAGADTETCDYGNSSNAGYDELGRLIRVNCLNGSTAVWGQTFSYDQYDNLSKSVPSGQTGISWLPGYNSANNQYLLSGTSYDSNGNLKADTVNTYTWNQDNHPLTVNSGISSVLYDALGRRVEWKSSSQYKQTMFSPLGPVAVMIGQTISQFRVPLPGGDTAISNVNFEHKDWLGSASLVSNRNRTAGSIRLFAPYGEVYNNMGGTGAVDFTGDFSDLVASLYDTPSREQAPTQGRWVSPDPAGSAWNVYAYATNPMGEIDPSGASSIAPCQSGRYCQYPTGYFHVCCMGQFGGPINDHLTGAIADLEAVLEPGWQNVDTAMASMGSTGSGVSSGTMDNRATVTAYDTTTPEAWCAELSGGCGSSNGEQTPESDDAANNSDGFLQKIGNALSGNGWRTAGVGGLAPQANGPAQAVKNAVENFMKASKPDPTSPVRNVPGETPDATKLSPLRQLMKDGLDELGGTIAGAASGAEEFFAPIIVIPHILVDPNHRDPNDPNCNCT